ncbi:hypothetical protein [Corynebacterium riegelii]|uniref:hypothetical protein n=1 Tax=Corynebacterium riegelii TaxID=156976 RepID=UPI0023F1DB12|nr:hypothetical protein [Corynebacterium riegelii]
MKRFATAAVAACVAATVFVAPANAAHADGRCPVYLETDEQREIGWHFTKILPKMPEAGEITPAVYLTESEAKDVYGEMAAISESDLTSINGAFNTPEHLEAFKQVRAKVKQCAEPIAAGQTDPGKIAGIVVAVLALVGALVGLALPLAKELLPRLPFS